MPNTFLEKTIEDWLTKTSELGYQLPFCQLLTSRGFRVVHISKHNAFEQGKDIIAVDAAGAPHGFQLKGGNISLSKWRDVVRAEVDELIELRIKHPSIDPAVPHKSYLVTNGFLDDTVRLIIDELNTTKWKDAPLTVWTRGHLLPEFIEFSGVFVPQKLKEYRTFLELYFADGRGFADITKVSTFLHDLVALYRNDNSSKEQRKRNVASAVLYTAYILERFRESENQVAVLQTLTVLGATILALSEKHSLPDAYWRDSFDLVMGEIRRTSELLVDELGDRPPIFKDSPYDGALAPYRRQMALSFYLAHFVSLLFVRDDGWRGFTPAVINPRAFHLWGEGAVPDFIHRALLFRAAGAKDDEVLGSILAALDVIVSANGRGANDVGLASPFYTVNDVAAQVTQTADEPVYERFTGSSYTIASLILFLAHFGRREELAKRWREITYISQPESVPDRRWEDLVWRCEEGVLRSIEPNFRESWSALEKWAGETIDAETALTIRTSPSFLPFFLAVFPHRLRPSYMRVLLSMFGDVTR
jgi:hypothetical protein